MADKRRGNPDQATRSYKAVSITADEMDMDLPYPLTPAAEAAARRPTVLFVDDEPLIVKSLARAFRREALDVRVATDAEHALSIITSAPVDVIVTDFRMPDLLGTELLRRARDVGCTALAILLTGQSDGELVRRALDDGVLDVVIHKPWRDALLRATVLQAARVARSPT